LEFGQPTGVFGTLFRLYSRTLIPWLGSVVSGQREAYEYLPRTAARFPAGGQFLELMEQVGGFEHAHAQPLTFGTAYVYLGQVR